MTTVLEAPPEDQIDHVPITPEQPTAAESQPRQLEKYEFIVGDQWCDGEESAKTSNRLDKAFRGEGELPAQAKINLEAGMMLEQVADEQRTGNVRRVLPEHLLADNRRGEIAELAKIIGHGQKALEDLFSEAEHNNNVRQLANLKAIGMRLLQGYHPQETEENEAFPVDRQETVLLGQMMAQRTEAAMLEMKMAESSEELKKAVSVKNARQFARSFWKAAQDQALPEEHRQRLKEVTRKLVEEYKKEPGFNVVIKDAAGDRKRATAAARQPEAQAQPASGEENAAAAARRPETPTAPPSGAENRKTAEIPPEEQYSEREKFKEQAREFNERTSGQQGAVSKIEAVEEGEYLPKNLKNELWKQIAEDGSSPDGTGRYLHWLEHDLDYGRNLADGHRFDAMLDRIDMRMQVAGGIHSPRVVGGEKSGFWQEAQDYIKAAGAIFNPQAQKQVMTARESVIRGLRKMAIKNEEQAGGIYSRLASKLEEINSADKSRQAKAEQERERRRSKRKWFRRK